MDEFLFKWYVACGVFTLVLILAMLGVQILAHVLTDRYMRREPIRLEARRQECLRILRRD